MKIGEILRKMADIMDAQDNSQDQSQEPTAMVQGDEPKTTAQGIEGDAQVNTVSMVAPLQQKLELLKKAAGVDNMYDSEGTCDVCGAAPCECADDNELDAIKKNAGIPVAIQVSAEDNDIEG
jgi:hypothetical protein